MKISKNKKFVGIILSMLFVVSGTAFGTSPAFAEDAGTDGSIVILYTNDVHCGLDDAVGYAGLAAYKKELEQDGTPVMLIDCGDSVQGGLVSTVSKGEAVIDIMNAVGYDAAVPGNHEFDYTVSQCLKFAEIANFQYISCNFIDLRTNKPVFEPYIIKEVGGKRIGLIGAITPETVACTTSAYYKDEDGNEVYTFSADEDGSKLYDVIQRTVDKVREENVDICILAAHLGVDESAAPFRSTDVIRSTNGIDVVLDGHSHSVIASEEVKNKDGDTVILSQTGTKLNSIGKLTISGENIKTELISDVTAKDSGIENVINSKKEECSSFIQRKEGETSFPLVCVSPEDSSLRIVRSMETNLGDFCTDAYRYAADADIGVANAGSIRADIPAGDITYADLLNVHPFDNALAKIKCKGRNIADALEFGASHSPEVFGGFLQVSGLTFDIDLSKTANIVLDENDVLKEIKDGERRVCNIKVNGEPLEEDKYYTVSGNDFMLINGGDGNTAFKGEKIELDKPITDIEALTLYLDSLNGVIPETYSDIYGDGRINFVNSQDNTVITILYNGDKIDSDAAPYIKNGAVLVPLRSISETFGAQVDFDAETKTASAQKDGITANIRIGSSTAFAGGRETELSAPAEISGGRTMVPLRFISDVFGVEADWDAETKTVMLSGAK